MAKTWKTALIATMITFALIMTSCTSAGTSTSDSAGKSGSKINDINLGVTLDVTSWDPAKADIGFDGPYLSAVYDPLVALNKHSKPVPALATSWKWSHHHTTLTMRLRNGVKFADGQKFDARAAVINLKHLMHGSRSGSSYRNVDKVAAAGSNTIKLGLKKRDDSLLYFMGLGRSWMASPAAIKKKTLSNRPVGSGPYAYNKGASKPQSQYVFNKKKQHWDSKTYPFSKVQIYPISDETASFNAMLSGQTNVSYANAENLDQAKEHHWNISKTVASWVGLQFADRNGSQLPALGNRKVRQAISTAFNSNGILKAVGSDDGVATNQLFPVDSKVYDTSLNNKYSYDADKAKRLLAEAGYPHGFTVKMPMSPLFQNWQAAATQELKQIGIKVKWENMSSADYMKNAPTYPMFISLISMDSNDMASLADQITSQLWYNPKPSLKSHPEVKKLVNKIHHAHGNQRTELLRRLNKKLVDLAWWNVWYQAHDTYFSVPGIKVTPITGMKFPTLRFIQRD